jgi:MoaA/NifB/PqqE/SkfB family radical SAM enzyme
MNRARAGFSQRGGLARRLYRRAGPARHGINFCKFIRRLGFRSPRIHASRRARWRLLPEMSLTPVNYLANLLRLLRGDRMLAPLLVSYCVTATCNLNCRYCEDFGARRNADAIESLSLADAKRLLGVIRQATDSLIFTGGEPLLYPDLESLAAYARNELRFRSLTLLTNGTLLLDHQSILKHVHRLVISLDAVDPLVWDQTLRAAPGMAQVILDTLVSVAQSRHLSDVRLAVHCVVSPETLSQAQAVLDFCRTHRILFSCSPQSVNNWPSYGLLVSDEYRTFIARLIELKKSGALILGSLPYLRLMMNFEPYPCYPLVAPRVMPDGTLAFPCRPIERSGNAHGGHGVNLLDAGNWAEALRRSIDLYGTPPLTCGSCYQQCYAEPSLMQARPFDLLREVVAFPSSRQASIYTYAPG